MRLAGEPLESLVLARMIPFVLTNKPLDISNSRKELKYQAPSLAHSLDDEPQITKRFDLI